MKYLAILICALFTLPAFAAKPDNPGNSGNKGKPTKVLICHYGAEDVLDDEGQVVLGEDGEPLTETVTAIIRIPEHAAAKHIEKHGDVPLETGDEEADAAALAACVELLGDDDDEPNGD